jgi:polar amino acid transport system substrate-binding protein
MFSRIRSTALLGAFLGAVALPATAITFLTEENPPYNHTRGGKPAGLSTDIVTEAAKRAGLAADIKFLDWEEAYQRAQADKDACLYSVARLENRENLFQWVGEIAVNKWAVFGRSDFNKPIKSVTDLRPFKIGGVATDAKVETLRNSAVTNVLEVVRDEMNPPRLFLKQDDPNRIDLWVTGYYAASATAAAAKAGPIKLVYVLREQPLWLACSPRTGKDVVKKLSDAIAAMKKDGTHKRLIDAMEKTVAR